MAANSTFPSGKVALVFGASGISGWAVTKNLLAYPTATTFSRVIGLTNKPLSVQDSRLPADPRLELYSGVDLRGDLQQVKKQMVDTIPRLNEVTHMYYCAYSNTTAYTEDVLGIRNINVGMTGNAVHATDELCTSLEFLVLQTGTNHYGVAVFQYMDKISINPPLKEETPRIPSPYGDEIFYYAQVDLIKEAAKGKSWKWCEVRPDQIIGFVPSLSSMTYIEPLALYLSLYRHIHGLNAHVPFPGTPKNYTYTYTDSSQDIISRAEIYLSTMTPDAANGEAFNIADTAKPGPWSIKWPILAEYFGLVGEGPGEQTGGWGQIDVWWEQHQKEYGEMCEQYGLRKRVVPKETWIFVKAGLTLLERNREMCLDKIRGVGFLEELEVGKGHYVGFDRFVEAGIIPPRQAMCALPN